MADGIGIPGEPERFEMSLHLEPVGADWDGSIRPVEFLEDWMEQYRGPKDAGRVLTASESIPLVSQEWEVL